MFLYSPVLRRSRRKRSRPGLRLAVRVAAGAALTAAVVLPPLRKRIGLRPAATTVLAAAGPPALAVLARRTRLRDAAIYGLQMWGFAMIHEVPFDDPQRLRRRLRIQYPIAADRLLGGGELPNVRMQRALGSPGTVTGLDRLLSIVHWAWFFEPHAVLAFVLARHPERFPKAARQMAATYDLGCAIYFAVPTAPPWWSSEQGYLDAGSERVGDGAERAGEKEGAVASPTEVRRIMADVGEDFWGRAWPALYDSLGGNPWAAMPSLHFATSLMAALHLTEAGPLAGAAGWAYAGTLAVALVYLGEHYVTDLIAGAALVAAVRRLEPASGPLAACVSDGLQRLERVANR